MGIRGSCMVGVGEAGLKVPERQKNGLEPEPVGSKQTPRQIIEFLCNPWCSQMSGKRNLVRNWTLMARKISWAVEESIISHH